MKKITTLFKALLLLVILSGSAKAQICGANFIWSNQANGAVSFTSTSVFSSSITQGTYLWSFGNNTTFSATGFSGMNASTTYTANGTYVVTLFISQTAPTCSNAISYTVNVTNASNTPTCALNANFTIAQSANGFVQFNSTSTGTATGVTYNWNYGDNTAAGTSPNPVHTFSANGSYLVTMLATNNATCTSTKTLQVNVNTYCNLVANYTFAYGNNGQVNFSSSSTGTINGAIYQWFFGDGASVIAGPTTAHTYSNGVYNALLLVMNNSLTPSCQDTVIKTIAVTNNTCGIAANFNSVVQTGGLVNFNNTSTGTISATTYTWNFGNGFISNSANPTVTYASSGIYLVTLTSRNASNCSSVITKSVNITGIACVANANFTLIPTNTPQLWVAVPVNPWNVANASWSWGDGTANTNTLYAAHQYSVAGMYNICLTVTASCGASASACASYSVYRGSAAAAIINVNVLQPALKNLDQVSTVGLKDLQNSVHTEIYPNPGTGYFNVNVSGLESEKAKLSVYSITGALLYTSDVNVSEGQLKTDVSLQNAESGIYFLTLTAGNTKITQKLIVTK
jgi:PKD repeat protein